MRKIPIAYPATFGFCLLVFLTNGRPIGSGDTLPAVLTSISICRGGGPYLDRFEDLLKSSDGRLPDYATTSRGHIVSRYPLATSILALPLIYPHLVLLDRIRPGWESQGLDGRDLGLMEKYPASVIAALEAVAILGLLRSLGLGSWAFPACLGATFGSGLWVIASQALWQHGPASLSLTLALCCLASARPRPILAGTFVGLLICFRLTDLFLGAGIFAWVFAHRRRDLGRFLVIPVVLGAALATYNVLLFNFLAGGQSQLESLHPKIHEVAATWTTNHDRLWDWRDNELGRCLGQS